MALQPEHLLRQIRRLMAGQDPDTDPILLDRFVRLHDDDAFAELVRRHGAMVLGVCHRVLHDEHQAEEVFQATFFVLARKASRIRSGTSLASWLHSVARHVALKCRRDEERRRRREVGRVQTTIAPLQRGPLDELTARELLLAVDEELQRLPEVYRLPLILCALEGHTTEEAARRLGWSVGSVRGRLVRGRARLHARLARRGLTLGTGSLAMGALREVAAGLSPKLMEATVRSALLFAAGRGAIGTGVSCKAAALAEGVMKTMLVAKIKTVTVLLGMTLCLTGAGVLAYQALGVNTAEPLQPAVEPRGEAEAPGQPGPDKRVAVRVDCYGDPLPEGALARLGTVRLRHGEKVRSVAFSPDGKTMASGGGSMMRLWEVATGKEIRTLKSHKGDILNVGFLSDSKTVVSGERDGTVRLWEAATGKEIRTLQVHGRGVWSIAFSSDGKTVASGGHDGIVRLWEVATGKEVRTLKGSKEPVWSVAFAPNGRTVATVNGNQVCLWDLLSGDQLPPLVGHRDQVRSVTFSPDGRTLASVSDDTTGLVWDLTYGTACPTTKLGLDALRALWANLANPDAARARQAVWTLAAVTPDQSVPLLRNHLQFTPAPDPKRLAQLITDLDAADFQVRQKAYHELEKLGPHAESALRKGLEGRSSLETRKRLEQVLEAVTHSVEVFCVLRAMEVLEQIGTPEARQVLKTLATDAPGPRLKQEAQATLDRLNRARRP